MIGSQLTRFQEDQLFLVHDVETGNASLNLAYARPWQIAWMEATLGGWGKVQTRLIKWDNLEITPDNPSFVHFNRDVYEREAIDPKIVWKEFGALLLSGKHRSVGHNLVGYDNPVIGYWQRAIGLVPDHSWLYNPPVIDTNCLCKAQIKQWVPDISSPTAFVAWQYRCAEQRLERGVKTKLGIMCKQFGIEYDPLKAHSASYDIECNWHLGRHLIKTLEF